MDSTRADTSITGARTSSRIPIISVICMALTSLVSRVTREAVENFSILEKAKSWMRSYSARRRLAPKPWPATEESTAEPRPKARDIMAMAIISPPSRRMKSWSPFLMPISTISLITRGISSSKTASAALHSTPAAIHLLYGLA